MEVTRQARQALAIEYTNVVSWAWEVDTGRVDAEPAFRELLLLPPEVPLSADMVLARIHPDDIQPLNAALDETIQTLAPYDFKFRIVGDEGQLRWLRGQGQVHEAHPNGTAKVIIGVNYDISEQVEISERLEAVVQEMRHRIKNSLAMVNSLATVTAREYQDVGEFIPHFRGRVEALASAQNIDVTSHSESKVDLAQAISGALSPFTSTSLWQDRFDINVEKIKVDQSLGQAICLVLYELGTNAVKYGALRFNAGEIAITSSAQNGSLAVEWHETHLGEKDHVAAEGSGFGNRLVARLVASENGEINISSTANSYTVRLSFPT
ncbi:MAG: HWE histidine kinase domain-containing protein [Pseudomonadota bacterium]